MKITRIREATAPIASEIRNAYITFSTMTVSLVAVETDVVRDGQPVIGYGFTSKGRYAQGGILVGDLLFLRGFYVTRSARRPGWSW